MLLQVIGKTNLLGAYRVLVGIVESFQLQNLTKEQNDLHYRVAATKPWASSTD